MNHLKTNPTFAAVASILWMGCTIHLGGSEAPNSNAGGSGLDGGANAGSGYLHSLDLPAWSYFQDYCLRRRACLGEAASNSIGGCISSLMYGLSVTSLVPFYGGDVRTVRSQPPSAYDMLWTIRYCEGPGGSSNRSCEEFRQCNSGIEDTSSRDGFSCSSDGGSIVYHTRSSASSSEYYGDRVACRPFGMRCAIDRVGGVLSAWCVSDRPCQNNTGIYGQGRCEDSTAVNCTPLNLENRVDCSRVAAGARCAVGTDDVARCVRPSTQRCLPGESQYMCSGSTVSRCDPSTGQRLTFDCNDIGPSQLSCVNGECRQLTSVCTYGDVDRCHPTYDHAVLTCLGGQMATIHCGSMHCVEEGGRGRCVP